MFLFCSYYCITQYKSQHYLKRFMKKIFTDQEISYCRGRYPQIAARFASKEAVMKALGTGIRGLDVNRSMAELFMHVHDLCNA